MAIYRFLNIVLFIAAFSCLLMCPEAHALCDGCIDYSHFLNRSDNVEIKKKNLKESETTSLTDAAGGTTNDCYTFFEAEKALYSQKSFTSPLIISCIATIRLIL